MKRASLSRLVVAIAVAVGVGALALPAFCMYADRIGHVRVANTKVTLHAVLEAMGRYQVEHTNACPPSLQALVDEGYLTRPLRDAWGRPLAFTCPGLHDREGADVASAGRDGRPGTADDIASWDL